MSGRSGADVGARNVERLKDYLDGLAQAGHPLPSREGKPNVSAIAIACGFDRQVLYKNPAAAALLRAYVAGPESQLSAPERAQPERKPVVDRRDKRILQLEQQLAAARAEVAGLREQLRRYRHVEDHMVETGRGVRRPSDPSLGGTGGL